MAHKNTPFLKDAILHIPHIIGLVDKNRYSPTYGCFDRNFWHYKTIDFPTGMAQLGVLSLALVYANDFKDDAPNPWHKNARIKELILAGMRYMPKCSHKDGTTDEFYPFERALGATAFSLIAASEAYLMMDLGKEEDTQDIVDFFRKRADWMIHNAEPAPIANHLAGAALALINIYLITKDKKYLNGAKKKMKETLAFIYDEGWFQEYDGCDIGYLTFTIDYIAKYYVKTGDGSVLGTLEKAVRFCSYFIHPDGSFAGEYGSRNTGHFLPAGFQILGSLRGKGTHGPSFALARSILDAYREGFINGKHEHMDDEKYLFYNVNNYMQAYLYETQGTGHATPTSRQDIERQVSHSLPCDGPDFSQYFEKAGIYVRKQKDIYAIVNIAKGGVMKVYKGRKWAYSFTGFIGKTGKGERDVLTTQIYGGVLSSHVSEDSIEIEGTFQRCAFNLQTTDKFFALRSVMLTAGRLWKVGSFIKHVLVKKLITKKKKTDKKYVLKISFTKEGVELRAEIDQQRIPFVQLHETTDLALIQVPTSRYYQEINISGWTSIPCKKERIILTRKI